MQGFDAVVWPWLQSAAMPWSRFALPEGTLRALDAWWQGHVQEGAVKKSGAATRRNFRGV